MQDLDGLMKDRHSLSEYANDLEQMIIDKDSEAKDLTNPLFSDDAGMPNLVVAYATHSRRETQPRDKGGSLIQLRNWEEQGVDDLSLIESLVARDLDGIKPGHDYQQLALDRKHLAKTRLELAEDISPVL